jgi:DNA polymerase III epsilon subunit
MKWTDCRLVAFDTETTGLRSYDGDRIIEFGAVEIFVNESLQITRVKQHQFMINPEMSIPREATAVSGIRDEDVAKAPNFAKVARDIWELLSGAILIAHNFSFDYGFLRNEFQRVGRYWPQAKGEIDTLQLARRFMRGLRSKRLENVAKELRVPLENAHRAVNDAEACGRVFIAMTSRYEAPRDLEELLEWAIAVGPPPHTGHIDFVEKGIPEFLGGPHKGNSVDQHPDYLQWMTIAQERENDVWRHRFPQSLRTWVRRWLRARAAGDATSALKSTSRLDWQLDPTPWRMGE